MSTSKPTKGSFIVRETGEWPYTNHWLGIYSDTGTGQVAKVEGWGETSRERANLIADALNVHAETGLTPRELLAQRDELREALQILAAYPLESFALEEKPDSHPLFGADDWRLQAGHIRAARAAIAKSQPKDSA